MKPARLDSALRTAVTLLVAASFGCTAPAPEPPPAAPAPQAPYAAYVLLVEAPDHTPVPFARVRRAIGHIPSI